MTNHQTLIKLTTAFTVSLIFLATQAQLLPSQNEKQHSMEKTDQNMYGKTGVIKAQKGSADELADLLLQAASMVSTADGCRLYVVGRDTNDENIIWITEIWDSKEDHTRSLQMEEVRELIEIAMPLIDSFPDGGAELNILGGWGIDK